MPLLVDNNYFCDMCGELIKTVRGMHTNNYRDAPPATYLCDSCKKWLQQQRFREQPIKQHATKPIIKESEDNEVNLSNIGTSPKNYFTEKKLEEEDKFYETYFGGRAAGSIKD